MESTQAIYFANFICRRHAIAKSTENIIQVPDKKGFIETDEVQIEAGQS